MRLQKLVIVTIFLFVFIVSTGSAISAQAPIVATMIIPPAIKLQAGTFVPSQGDFLEIPDALRLDRADFAPDQPGYYIVQFGSPVQQTWKKGVEKAGGEILEYIPDYAFKVFMTPAEAQQVSRQRNVIWVGGYQPAYKIDDSLPGAESTLMKIRIESNATTAELEQAILATGATILEQDDRYAILHANQTQLIELARIEGIAWIEQFSVYEKHNEYGAGAILGANVANANGYDGSSQIAAVADSGLGGGTAATAHPDIAASRIVAIQDFAATSVDRCYNAFPDGAQDVEVGHGTHTAVSVVGGGNVSGEGKGTAPGASLLFQSVEDYIEPYGLCSSSADGYYLVGLPADMHDLFQPAYAAGARIHSNSWGSNAAGAYTADSAATDDFMWNNPDMLVTFSAGNEGVDANGNGVIDNDSMGAPSTAKNVLSVGASENDRNGDYACDTSLTYTSKDGYQIGETCSSMGGQNLLGTWGSRYGITGPMADDPTAGNKEQMAGWSSRGPTDDGRIKPDVVAPGTWVLSGYSGLYQEGYGDPTNPQNGAYQWDGWGMPRNADYKYMGGTSMSNPIAAGAATVVRDYYNKAHTHDASAALVKAALINSAVDLLDENNDGVDDNDYPIPNVHEGWGRVDLANATDGSHQFIDDASGLGTSGTASHQFSLGTGGQPFKVTLVWTDFASTEAAAVNLVNDLNLTVTGPGGSPVYQGNVFSAGWTITGGSADNTNNVENVFIQSAAAGTWTVEVSGANIPQGPQPFALIVDGAFGTPPAAGPNVQVGTVIGVGNAGWTTVNLPSSYSYTSMVVVASANYDNNVAPVVVRIRNAAGSSFDVRADGTKGTDIISGVTIHYTVVEEGVYTEAADGVKMEAVKFTSSITDRSGSWVGQSQTYSNSYTNPVVVGQVMTYNDPAWSTFWARGSSRFVPPSSSTLYAGKMIGEDSTIRADETIGYIVVESGQGSVSGLDYLAALGSDTIFGITNSPPYTYGLSGLASAQAAIISQSGMDGGNGGWALLYGANPLSATGISLAIDEDQVLDLERNHTTEQVSYVVFGVAGQPDPADVIYVSSTSGGTAGDVSFADEDILAYNSGTGVWSMYFDGSDVGLNAISTTDVDAFHLLDDGSLLLSLAAPASLPDVGLVDDSDIVRFVGTFGSTTAGTYEWYFDGSDVELTTESEDVAAIGFAPDGRLLISMKGPPTVSGVTGDNDEDLLAFDATSLGVDTGGTWSMYFDGTDVELNTTSSEDLFGAYVDAANNDIYLTTLGGFEVTGAIGDGADIFVCTPGSLGVSTTCTYSMYWDGSANDYGGEVMDGLHIVH